MGEETPPAALEETEETAEPAETDELKQLRSRLWRLQSKFAWALFLLFFPPLLLCDKSFGMVGWGIAISFCFTAFLAHRMLPPFLTKQGLPTQDVPRVQIALQGIPFLFGMMALVNPTLIKIQLDIPHPIFIGAIAVTSTTGLVLAILRWTDLRKLSRNPDVALLKKTYFQSQ